MTSSQSFQQAAEAENVRRHVTRNHLDGNVRWKGKRSDIGPFLLRVNQSIDGWFAQEVKTVTYSDGYYQQGAGILVRGLGTADQAIRAGLLALAKRAMTRAEKLRAVADTDLSAVAVKDGHVYLEQEKEPLFGLVQFSTGAWRWCSYPAGILNPQGHDSPDAAIKAGLVIAAEREELKNAR